MREAARFDDERVRTVLRDAYGLHVAALVFLALGNDADSWSYRVEAAGERYFLKVRSGTGAMPGATVPWRLARHGVEGVLAPITTRAETAFVTVDGYELALYPMVDGRTGKLAGLSAAQWRAFGRTVRQIHEVQVGHAGDVRRETFVPSRRELLPELEHLLTGPPTDAVARDLAALWHEHREVIDALVARTDAWGSRPLAYDPVLCHADLHTNNVLVDGNDRLWVIDWDEALVAPRERDVMFAVGGGISRDLVSDDATAAFLEGYGPVELDERLLGYYRAAWAVQDIAANGEQAVLTPGLTEPSRRDAVDDFAALFLPGRIVDLATGA